MILKDYFNWLREENLLKAVMKQHRTFESIFRHNLHVKDERIILIGDIGFPMRRVSAMLLGCYALSAKRLGLQTDLEVVAPQAGYHNAPDKLISSILNSGTNNIVILNTSGNFGSMRHVGTTFRRVMMDRQHKFIKTTGLANIGTGHFHHLMDSLNVDYDALKAKAALLKHKLDNANTVQITTRKGTDLTIDISGRESCTNVGDYQNFSTGGNMPCGEVYIPPNMYGAEGKLVIDESMKVGQYTVTLDKPVTFYISEGEIKSVKGDKKALLFLETLQNSARRAKDPSNVKKVAELGIGINPSTKFLETTIINEKVLGTAHIAFGGNSWFGGDINVGSHYDHVFKDPVIRLDGQVLPI